MVEETVNSNVELAPVTATPGRLPMSKSQSRSAADCRYIWAKSQSHFPACRPTDSAPQPTAKAASWAGADGYPPAPIRAALRQTEFQRAAAAPDWMENYL